MSSEELLNDIPAIRSSALSKSMRTVAPHFQAFYAALTPDQQHQLDVRPRRWR